MIYQSHCWAFISRNENLCPHKHLYTIVLNSFIYNSQEQETTKYPKNSERLKKQQQYIHIMEYYSAVKRKKLLKLKTTRMDLKSTVWNNNNKKTLSQKVMYHRNPFM